MGFLRITSVLIKPGQNTTHTLGLIKEHYIGDIHSGRGLCSPISHCTLGAVDKDLANLSIGLQEAFTRLIRKVVAPPLA